MNDSSASPLPASDASGPEGSTSPEASTGPDEPLEPSDDPPPHLLVDNHDGLGQRCLKSLAAFEPGDVLSDFSPRCHSETASRMTVQVAEDRHIELAPTYLELINHSCDPNVFFDAQRWQLVALRTIAPGDELCFFYPSTEWEMASPFECGCGSQRCLGRITGASKLPREVLAGHRLAPHVHRLLALQDEREGARERGLFAALFAPA